MNLTATDFPCPKCRAQQGQPCLSLGGADKKAGEPVNRPHAERSALVPKVSTEPACGTRSGYQRHIRQGTPTCAPCREANAAWRRDYRAERAADYEHEKRVNAARSRALWRLSKRHYDEFQRYVSEELRSA